MDLVSFKNLVLYGIEHKVGMEPLWLFQLQRVICQQGEKPFMAGLVFEEKKIIISGNVMKCISNIVELVIQNVYFEI